MPRRRPRYTRGRASLACAQGTRFHHLLTRDGAKACAYEASTVHRTFRSNIGSHTEPSAYAGIPASIPPMSTLLTIRSVVASIPYSVDVLLFLIHTRPGEVIMLSSTPSPGSAIEVTDSRFPVRGSSRITRPARSAGAKKLSDPGFHSGFH